MEISQIVLWVLGVVCACLGWFCREIYGMAREQKKELSDLHILISTEYVRYDRMQDMFKPVMEALQEIKQSLNQKVDK